MNQNARIWVRALLSGKYKQGKGRLKLRNKYCCLGVACELYKELVGDLDARNNCYDGCYASLPDKVQDWLGMVTCDGDHLDTDLIILNDNDHTFEEIAQAIINNQEEIFHGSEMEKVSCS